MRHMGPRFAQRAKYARGTLEGCSRRRWYLAMPDGDERRGHAKRFCCREHELLRIDGAMAKSQKAQAKFEDQDDLLGIS